jgi:uncharacterized protein (DUF58 family)
VTRTGNPRLLGYATLAALGLLASLAVRRPELAVVAAPFALFLALGSRARDPGLEVTVELGTERTLEGDAVPMTVTLRAPHAIDRADVVAELPRDVELADGELARSVRLEAGEERELELAIRCTSWGVYDVGELRIHARDPFRLVTWAARVDAAHRLKAYPRPVALRRLLEPMQTQAFAGSQVARVKGDGVEYADIREFVPGDRVRSINWRASARRSALVVNERHPERNTDVVLFVDSFTDVRGAGRSLLEEAIRAAATLATKYLERRDRVGLVGFGGVLRWLQPGMGASQRYRLVETMLETDVAPTYTWRDVNIIPARTLPTAALVVALSPLVDPRFVAALEDLRGRRFDVAVVELDPVPLVGPGPSEVERAAYRLWLLDREARRARLESRGIGVATWGDDGLDAVLEEVRTFRRHAHPARG